MVSSTSSNNQISFEILIFDGRSDYFAWKDQMQDVLKVKGLGRLLRPKEKTKPTSKSASTKEGTSEVTSREEPKLSVKEQNVEDQAITLIKL